MREKTLKRILRANGKDHGVECGVEMEEMDDMALNKRTLLSWLDNRDADVVDALLAQECNTRETLRNLKLVELKQVLEEERVSPRKLGALKKILVRLQDQSEGESDSLLNTAIGGECSFEDVELLLNNLILFDTFIFGFAVTLMTTFDHDDLLAADTRYWKLEPGYYLSHSFLFCSVTAALILIASLMIGLMLAISLGFSKCREQPHSFRRWIVIGQPLTCIAYLLFIVGFGFFFIASSQAVDLKFPRYPLSPTRGATFNYNGLGEESLRFNSTTETLILVETAAETYDGKYVREWWFPLGPDSAAGRSFGLGWVFAYRAFFTSAGILIVFSVLGVVGIALFNLHDSWHERHWHRPGS